MFSTWKSYF